MLNKKLVAIFLEKKKVVLDRKYSVGFTILELSKLAMFQYYYDVILPRFGRRNVSILLSDTDSFIFHIKNYTKNEIRWKLGDVMDFSNIPAANKMCNATRKNVPGFLKDETPAGDIVECIALKSKCYALRTHMSATGEMLEEKKYKGITKPRVKRMCINNYRSFFSQSCTSKHDSDQRKKAYDSHNPTKQSMSLFLR